VWRPAESTAVSEGEAMQRSENGRSVQEARASRFLQPVRRKHRVRFDSAGFLWFFLWPQRKNGNLSEHFRLQGYFLEPALARFSAALGSLVAVTDVRPCRNAYPR